MLLNTGYTTGWFLLEKRDKTYPTLFSSVTNEKSKPTYPPSFISVTSALVTGTGYLSWLEGL